MWVHTNGERGWSWRLTLCGGHVDGVSSVARKVIACIPDPAIPSTWSDHASPQDRWLSAIHAVFISSPNILLWVLSGVGIGVLPHGSSLGVIVGRVWIQVSEVLQQKDKSSSWRYISTYFVVRISKDTDWTCTGLLGHTISNKIEGGSFCVQINHFSSTSQSYKM